MDGWETKKVLIIVKTYPTPSQKYYETVCTAGITDDSHFIRLYPVPYRSLRPNQKYHKFDWIEVDVQKSYQDKRPESYKVRQESIKIIGHLDSRKNSEERKTIILPLVSSVYSKTRKALKYKGLRVFKF
jgi:hypothetical protein